MRGILTPPWRGFTSPGSPSHPYAANPMLITSKEFLFFHQMYIFDIGILATNVWSITSRWLFHFINFSMNPNGISNELNLNEIKFHKHFSWDG